MPTLVLGGTVTGLGAVRSLGPLGIPAYVSCAPDDVAAMTAFLLSDAGRNISGQSLGVDGNVEAL